MLGKSSEIEHHSAIRAQEGSGLEESRETVMKNWLQFIFFKVFVYRGQISISPCQCLVLAINKQVLPHNNRQE
jgi:hypothetical protein